MSSFWRTGLVGDYPSLARLIKQKDVIVCVDGGLRHAETLGLIPDLVLGDMDSVDQDRLAALPASVEIVQYPVEKDETDLELALSRVADQGYGRVLVAGISGGRIDHTLANIHLMARHDWCGELCFWEQGQMAWFLAGGGTLELEQHAGHTLSLIPMADRVTGVTTRGLKYPLEKADLIFGTTRGISNIVQMPYAQVSFVSGRLLVVLTRKELV